MFTFVLGAGPLALGLALGLAGAGAGAGAGAALEVISRMEERALKPALSCPTRLTGWVGGKTPAKNQPCCPALQPPRAQLGADGACNAGHGGGGRPTPSEGSRRRVRRVRRRRVRRRRRLTFMVMVSNGPCSAPAMSRYTHLLSTGTAATSAAASTSASASTLPV